MSVAIFVLLIGRRRTREGIRIASSLGNRHSSFPADRDIDDGVHRVASPLPAATRKSQFFPSLGWARQVATRELRQHQFVAQSSSSSKAVEPWPDSL